MSDMPEGLAEQAPAHVRHARGPTGEACAHAPNAQGVVERAPAHVLPPAQRGAYPRLDIPRPRGRMMS
jgi:hypothetical protein